MSANAITNISELVKKMDHEGDPITFCKQTQFFAKLAGDCFQTDEEIVSLFQHLNQLALSSEDIAINLPHILLSRAMEDFRFAKSHTTIRNEILRVLQGNFTNHVLFKEERIEKADNAITLLGECYNLLRINSNPISIVGQSLLQLLEQELKEVLQRKTTLRAAFAKLVLTQVTLNGLIFKKHEVEKFNSLLDTIRRVIVEADAKSIRGKAFLMLTLDLFYNNFTTNAMLSLHKVYGAYLDESSSSAFSDDQQVPEKRQRVEAGVQTEVAVSDVFRAGPVIMSPVERASVATTCTNISISREDSSRVTPLSPSNSSGTRKSKIDPRIRNVKIGRIYPSPSSRNVSSASVTTTGTSADGSGPEVGKLSIKNVTLHELAMMKENPSHLNRITNDYLDRLVPPSEVMCPSIKSSSEYTGKENDQMAERPESVKSGRLNNGSGVGSKRFGTTNGGGANRVTQKYQMEENAATIAFDPSYFDDVPNHERAAAKSFLHFLENK